MEKNLEIGRAIYRTAQRISKIHIRNQADAGLDQDTIMYGWIIHYIGNHGEGDIYQKDIEKKTGLNKSTVSTILTNLEAKDYVKRCPVPGDGRLKKLILTEHGYSILDDIHHALNRADDVFSNGLSEEEQDTFLMLLRKVENNLTEMEERMSL